MEQAQMTMEQVQLHLIEMEQALLHFH